MYNPMKITSNTKGGETNEYFSVADLETVGNTVAHVSSQMISTNTLKCMVLLFILHCSVNL